MISGRLPFDAAPNWQKKSWKGKSTEVTARSSKYEQRKGLSNTRHIFECIFISTFIQISLGAEHAPKLMNKLI